MLHFLSIFIAASDKREIHWCVAVHAWVTMCMAGEAVAMLMSGDDARDEQQLSTAILWYTTCTRRCR